MYYYYTELSRYIIEFSGKFPYLQEKLVTLMEKYKAYKKNMLRLSDFEVIMTSSHIILIHIITKRTANILLYRFNM